MPSPLSSSLTCDSVESGCFGMLSVNARDWECSEQWHCRGGRKAFIHKESLYIYSHFLLIRIKFYEADAMKKSVGFCARRLNKH